MKKSKREIAKLIDNINKVRPKGTPKVEPDIIGDHIIGIDIVKLDNDLQGFQPPEGEKSCRELMDIAYGESLAKEIEQMMSITDL
jgi:hypothetical protein